MRIFFKIFGEPNKKRVLFLTVLVLIALSYYNLYSVRVIKSTQLEEKFVEIKNIIDTVAAAINADADTHWTYHERNVIAHTESIDRLEQVYAAAYKYDGESLVLMTVREYETSPLDPFDFPESDVMFSGAESGRFLIRYKPDFQTERDMHLYYRWMPSYSAPYEKYLVIGGVTEYSIQTQIPTIFTIGQWVGTVIITALFFIFVFVDLALGHIWSQRGRNPYREKPEEI